ncbi:glycosyltransferase family 2 protein [Tenggerimyces flavus]|uniref:Glycosyltransferase family 2 protein n=1 Tax=Tenggerimyces flavus TaxID=1708749 RepID=A0ABV7YHT3_9ACTN|nr:glycosyltransferase family 2 protein [Tenggerimyces flavus]MBM7789827.1 glycosyltransferase involved in cell wall biosynthesis [Tenggerimyces flavus]
MKPALSVVVPCHNEAEVVTAAHASLTGEIAEVVDDYELVFVDDGSTDGTLELIRVLAAEDERVRFVAFSRNFGKEAAMLAGLRAANGEAVVIIDADLQHPPELVPRMLELHRKGFDQVVARRTRTGDKPTRTLAAKTYYKVMNRLVDVKLVDGVGDFRLLSRRAVDAVLALGEYNRFSKGLFSWIGYEQITIEYDNVQRAGGDSSWTFRSLLNYGIDGVLSFNNRPLRLSIYLGGIVILASMLYVLWLTIRVALFGVEMPGYVTLVAAVAGLGGIQLLFLGVIGEYIGRIYYETKRRPHFLVKDSNVPGPW